MNYLLTFLTQPKTKTLNSSKNDIEKIIQNLDSNNVHGHDKISIRMKLIKIAVNQFLNICSLSLINAKDTNVVPVHKKGDINNF